MIIQVFSQQYALSVRLHFAGLVASCVEYDETKKEMYLLESSRQCRTQSIQLYGMPPYLGTSFNSSGFVVEESKKYPRKV